MGNSINKFPLINNELEQHPIQNRNDFSLDQLLFIVLHDYEQLNINRLEFLFVAVHITLQAFLQNMRQDAEVGIDKLNTHALLDQIHLNLAVKTENTPLREQLLREESSSEPTSDKDDRPSNFRLK